MAIRHFARRGDLKRLFDADQTVTSDWTFEGDNTFSGENTFTHSRAAVTQAAIKLESDAPFILWSEDDQASDEKIWLWGPAGGNFDIQTRTDADGAGATPVSIQRGTGTTIDEIELNATTLDFNGALDLSGKATFNGGFPTATFSTTGTVEFQFNVTDAASNEKVWGFQANSNGDFLLRTRTDAGGIGTDAIAVRRGTGTAVDEVELNATLLDFNGAMDVSGQVTLSGGILELANSQSSFPTIGARPAIYRSTSGLSGVGVGTLILQARDDVSSSEIGLVAGTGPTIAMRVRGTDILAQLPIYISEQAAANSDIAGYGQLWVKNTTPCQLWFTDDAGNDTQIV